MSIQPIPDARTPTYETIPDGCPALGIASCLTCPLPKCRYDMSEEERAVHLPMLRLRRDADAAAGPPLKPHQQGAGAMFDAGIAPAGVAQALGISHRTAYRRWKVWCELRGYRVRPRTKLAFADFAAGLAPRAVAARHGISISHTYRLFAKWTQRRQAA